LLLHVFLVSLLSFFVAYSLLFLSRFFFFLLTPRPPTSTLFPYTTLFRSRNLVGVTSTSSSAAMNSIAVSTVSSRAGSSLIASSEDRKSTRLNSSHEWISYAVFCLKKKKKKKQTHIIILAIVITALLSQHN